MDDPYRVLQVVPEAESEVITAAYHALAKKYHPDRDSSSVAARRMREVNAAYTILRNPALASRWRREQRVGSHVTAAARPASEHQRTARSEGTRLAFGRYAGWRLDDLARQDPDYLRWLSRHSSGLAFRSEIYAILTRLGVPAA